MKFLLFFLLFVFSIQAEEPVLFLTWKKDPSKTMVAVWLSEDPCLNGLIQWKTEEETAYRQKAAIKTLVTACETNFYVFQAEMTFLKPDTVYEFKIEQASKSYKFKTAPKELNSDVRFIVGGDVYHDEMACVECMMKQAAKFDPLFCVIGGDLAYSFPSKKSEKEETKRWFEFLFTYEKTMVTPNGLMIPLIPVLGNHDIRTGYLAGVRNAPFFFSVFPFPGNMGYASLNFGRWLSLFILDSGHANPVSGAQSFWLQKSLETRIDFDYIFAIYHVGAYPSFRPFSNKRAAEIRKSWIPIFDRYQISGAFEHHDHTLKRTHPLKNNFIHQDGVTFFGDGSFGTRHPRKPHPKDQVWYLAYSSQSQAVWAVTLNKENAHFKALSSDGNTLDQTIKKNRKNSPLDLSRTQKSL